MAKLELPSPYVSSKTTSDDMMFEPTNPGKNSIESGATYDWVGEQQTSPPDSRVQPDDLAGKPEC